ncbi:MAG: hypothetical protein V2I56_03650 [Desulfobacteraceae bacterium]|jgi:CTP:molybdopterin cytidylyltransferase MocA|nr:hypothetical protein [Desulfobacteraceae bacterium]
MNSSVGVVVLASHPLKNEGPANKIFSDIRSSKINIYIDNILNSGIDDIVVVVNQEQWEIGADLSGYPVCMVVNDGLSDDFLNMVNTGMKALPGYITGTIIIKYGNQPIRSEKFAVLEKFHHNAPQCAVLPGDNRQNGYAALCPVESYHTLSNGLRLDNIIPQECGQLDAGRV